MRYIYSLVFAAALMLSPLAANAQSTKGKDWYGSIFVGTSFLTHDQSWTLKDPTSGNGADNALNNIEVEGKAGYYVGGAIGGWINNAQRMELAVGYRSYETAFRDSNANAAVNFKADGDINVITVMFNNYFYPLYAWEDSIPALAQNFYVGFGVGVGIWSFDVEGVNPDGMGMGDKKIAFNSNYGDTFSVLLSGSAGYEAYVSDMTPVPAALEGMAVGVRYEFTWGNPKPNSGEDHTATKLAFSNEALHQRNHNLLFYARYEF